MNPWDTLTFKSAARRGCSTAMLADFESTLAIKLPEDYRAFLIEVNGGKPTGTRQRPWRYASVPVEWDGRTPADTDPDTDVAYLLALEDWSSLFEEERSETLTLAGAYRMFVMEDPRLPAGLIPIGWGSGGNPILLDIATSKRGEVSLWVRDWFGREDFKTNPYHNIGHIAPSFSAFLEKIRFED